MTLSCVGLCACCATLTRKSAGQLEQLYSEVDASAQAMEHTQFQEVRLHHNASEALLTRTQSLTEKHNVIKYYSPVKAAGAGSENSDDKNHQQKLADFSEILDPSDIKTYSQILLKCQDSPGNKQLFIDPVFLAIKDVLYDGGKHVTSWRRPSRFSDPTASLFAPRASNRLRTQSVVPLSLSLSLSL